MSTAVVVATAGTAHASLWQVQDSFDPTSTWTFDRTAGDGGFDSNPGTARSPNNSAWMTIQSNGWSGVRRNVHLRPVPFHSPVNCAAQIYVQPLGTAKLNFEVIKPSTWTYIALKTVTLSGGSYQAVTTNSWRALDADVVVRVSLLYTGGFSAIRVDDLTVQCTYP